MPRGFKRLSFFILGCAFPVRASFNADFITGLWWTERKDAKVEIYREGGNYFGKLAWTKDDPGPDGKPSLDTENPFPELRSRPLHGLTFIKNLKARADASEWEQGEVYNSDNGKTYRFKISLVPNRGDAIKIHGYLGIPLFGGSEVWTRAE